MSCWKTLPFVYRFDRPGNVKKMFLVPIGCRWVPLGAVRCLNPEIVAAPIGTNRHHRDWRSGSDRHLRVK